MNRAHGGIVFRGLLVVVGVGIGCGGGALPGTVTQVVGTMGAEIQISADGNSQIAGTTLLIPAGALATDTMISVSSGDAVAATGETAIGPSVRFQPDGLVFAKPVTLTLPYSAAKQPASSSVAIDWNSGGTKGQLSGKALTIDKSAGTVTVDISHFTDYQVVAMPAVMGGACQSNSDCAAGQACVNGACAGVNADGGVVDMAPTDMTVIHDGSGGHDGAIDGGPVDGGPVDGGPTDLAQINDGGVAPDLAGGGGACASNADCPAGHSCINGVCN